MVSPTPSTVVSAPDHAAFKQRQKQMWSSFEGAAPFTIPAASRLVRFAAIRPGDKVLDVGTGTGNVALTAAHEGAQVSAIDLTPNLLEAARRMADLLTLKVDFREGDAEALAFPDGSFDVVTSQFGHIFAPRPEVAISEMLRVLKPGGRIAFSTWAPESLPGRMFAVQAKVLPPPPGVPPVTQWGEPAIIRQRLGSAVRDICFERGSFAIHALGPRHLLAFQEANLGPLKMVVENLSKSDPPALERLRNDYLATIEPYFDGNEARHDYLMTRAVKT